MVKGSDVNGATLTGEEDTGENAPSAKSSGIKIEVCKKITEWIFNELGMRSSDIASIY